jgi:hypothetical protein
VKDDCGGGSGSVRGCTARRRKEEEEAEEEEAEV